MFSLNTATGTVHREPEFGVPVQNISAPAGRDVKFACHVEHLGNYKVMMHLHT
jgi:hypothetical protein